MTPRICLLLIVSATALLFSRAPAHAEGDPLVRALPRAAPSVFQVFAAAGRSVSAGSAVSVGRGLFVTSCHVVAAADSVSISQTGDDGIVASLAAADYRRDVCVLKSETEAPVIAKIAPTSDMAADEPVLAIGYSGGRFTVSRGNVSQFYAMGSGRVIRATAGFTAGASGGGLFNAKGELVGILTFYKLTPEGDMFFSVPVSWINDVLSTSSVSGFVPEETPFWASDEGARPAFLQAILYEYEGRWQALENFCRDWLRTTPGSPEAMDFLNKALERQAQR